MINLSMVGSTRYASPPRIIIHGTGFVGKSTFFAGGEVSLYKGEKLIKSEVQKGAPSPIFIRTEDGLTGVSASAFPVAESFEDVMEALDSLLEEDHGYKTLVVDSLDWLEMLAQKKVCEESNCSSIEEAAGGYGKGYGASLSLMRSFLSKVGELNKRKGMLIGLICHSNTVRFSSPSEEPYDRFELKLHSPAKGKGARDMFVEWADIVGYASKDLVTDKEKSVTGDKIISRREKFGLSRLNLIGTPAFCAGNRYGMPAQMDLNFDVFLKKFREAKKKGNQAQSENKGKQS